MLGPHLINFSAFQLKLHSVCLPGGDTVRLCTSFLSHLAVTPGPHPSPAQITWPLQFMRVVSGICYLRKLKSREAQLLPRHSCLSQQQSRVPMHRHICRRPGGSSPDCQLRSRFIRQDRRVWVPLETVLGAGCDGEKTNASLEHVLMQFSSRTEDSVQGTLLSFINISVLCPPKWKS